MLRWRECWGSVESASRVLHAAFGVSRPVASAMTSASRSRSELLGSPCSTPARLVNFKLTNGYHSPSKLWDIRIWETWKSPFELTPVCAGVLFAPVRSTGLAGLPPDRQRTGRRGSFVFPEGCHARRHPSPSKSCLASSIATCYQRRMPAPWAAGWRGAVMSVNSVARRPKAKAVVDDGAGSANRVRGSGAQTVYETLRQSIIDLTLEPGSPLDEVSLSEQFAMSRTPIREALVRLSADGLVATLPNRNTIVSPIDFVRLPVYFEALTLMYRVPRGGGIPTQARATGDDPRASGGLRCGGGAARRHRHDLVEPGFSCRHRGSRGQPAFHRTFHKAPDEGPAHPQALLLLVRRQAAAPICGRARSDGRGDRGRRRRALRRTGHEHAAQIVRQILSYIARDTISGMKLPDIGG